MVLSSSSGGVTFLLTKMIRDGTASGDGTVSQTKRSGGDGTDSQTKRRHNRSSEEDEVQGGSWKREGQGFLAMEFKSFYSEIQDTKVDLLHQDA